MVNVFLTHRYVSSQNDDKITGSDLFLFLFIYFFIIFYFIFFLFFFYYFFFFYLFSFCVIRGECHMKGFVLF